MLSVLNYSFMTLHDFWYSDGTVTREYHHVNFVIKEGLLSQANYKQKVFYNFVTSVRCCSEGHFSMESLAIHFLNKASE